MTTILCINALISQPINCQCCPHIETGQLIYYANQLTGFYMRATLAFSGLKYLIKNVLKGKEI